MYLLSWGISVLKLLLTRGGAEDSERGRLCRFRHINSQRAWAIAKNAESARNYIPSQVLVCTPGSGSTRPLRWFTTRCVKQLQPFRPALTCLVKRQQWLLFGECFGRRGNVFFFFFSRKQVVAEAAKLEMQDLRNEFLQLRNLTLTTCFRSPVDLQPKTRCSCEPYTPLDMHWSRGNIT